MVKKTTMKNSSISHPSITAEGGRLCNLPYRQRKDGKNKINDVLEILEYFRKHNYFRFNVDDIQTIDNFQLTCYDMTMNLGEYNTDPILMMKLINENGYLIHFCHDKLKTIYFLELLNTNNIFPGHMFEIENINDYFLIRKYCHPIQQSHINEVSAFGHGIGPMFFRPDSFVPELNVNSLIDRHMIKTLASKSIRDTSIIFHITRSIEVLKLYYEIAEHHFLDFITENDRVIKRLFEHSCQDCLADLYNIPLCVKCTHIERRVLKGVYFNDSSPDVIKYHDIDAMNMLRKKYRRDQEKMKFIKAITKKTLFYRIYENQRGVYRHQCPLVWEIMNYVDKYVIPATTPDEMIIAHIYKITKMCATTGYAFRYKKNHKQQWLGDHDPDIICSALDVLARTPFAFTLGIRTVGDLLRKRNELMIKKTSCEVLSILRVREAFQGFNDVNFKFVAASSGNDN